jgi:hypothetical protein
VPVRNTEAAEHDMRWQGESTERLHLFIKNEAELAGLKELDEDSQTLFGCYHLSKLAIPAHLKQCVLL